MSRPASSARRWPDLLIGLLVALLLVGFGLLLFRPQGRPAAPTSATPTTESADTAATIPAAPGTDSAVIPDAAPTTETAPSQTGAAETDAAEPPTIAAAPEITQAPPSSAPDASADSDAQTPTEPSSGDSSADENPAAETTTAQPATPEDSAAPAADPRTGGAVATSERRTPLRSDYRITLGTFNTEQAARSGTAGVSTLGYTVYPIDLGSTVVAQVGPFADEASARQALADIQRAYPRALLYPPRNRSLNSEPASPATSSSSSTSTASPSAADAAPAREEAAAPAPAPSGPTYLQVGAFDRVESAQRLVGQLRDLGYSPTVNAPEGRKVSVLVGPFTGDALTRTETRLDGNGLDHFRVR